MTSSPPQTDTTPRLDDPVVTVTDASFLQATVGAVTLVDFWAPWCGPCRQFAPVFDGAARRFSDRIRFARCNVDEHPETPQLLQVMSIPTLVLFDHAGNEVGRFVGAVGPAALDRMLDDVLEHFARHGGEDT